MVWRWPSLRDVFGGRSVSTSAAPGAMMDAPTRPPQAIATIAPTEVATAASTTDGIASVAAKVTVEAAFEAGSGLVGAAVEAAPGVLSAAGETAVGLVIDAVARVLDNA